MASWHAFGLMTESEGIQRAIMFSESKWRQMRAVREELDREYDVPIGLSAGPPRQDFQHISDLTVRI